MVWCDDAAVGMLVPSGPAGGSWVLANADHVVAIVTVWGLLFGVVWGSADVKRRQF